MNGQLGQLALLVVLWGATYIYGYGLIMSPKWMRLLSDNGGLLHDTSNCLKSLELWGGPRTNSRIRGRQTLTYGCSSARSSHVVWLPRMNRPGSGYVNEVWLKPFRILDLSDYHNDGRRLNRHISSYVHNLVDTMMLPLLDLRRIGSKLHVA